MKLGLALQAYQRLGQDLMAGKYEPGQKLKLRDIATDLGISVTPVREALARLAVDLAVVQVDHKSVCVAVMDLDRFAEIRELRLDLEGKAAERSAMYATPADIRNLRSIHAALLRARARDSYPDILIANQQFHLAVCKLARMPVLLRIVETLWLQCGPLMHGMTRWPVAMPKPHPHLAVIKALEERQGLAARKAIQQDIMAATDALGRYLTSHRERPEWAKRALGSPADATEDAPRRRP